MIEPVFADIQQTIIDRVSRATTSIKVMMAWFTDYKLMNLLVAKAKSGVHVELILLNQTVIN